MPIESSKKFVLIYMVKRNRFLYTLFLLYCKAKIVGFRREEKGEC